VKVFFHARKQGVRCAVKYLYRCGVSSKSPVFYQFLNRCLVVHNEMRSLHIVIVEQVPHAVSRSRVDIPRHD